MPAHLSVAFFPFSMPIGSRSRVWKLPHRILTNLSELVRSLSELYVIIEISSWLLFNAGRRILQYSFGAATIPCHYPFHPWEEGGSSTYTDYLVGLANLQMHQNVRLVSKKIVKTKIAPNNLIWALSKENILVFHFMMTFPALNFKWKCSKNASKSLFLPKLFFFLLFNINV